MISQKVSRSSSTAIRSLSRHAISKKASGSTPTTSTPAFLKAVNTFTTYLREDGRAAIRNELWIVPIVGCVNGIAKQLVDANQDLVTGSIDGLYSWSHPFGCSQLGDDLAQTGKLLAALVRHPNAGGVLCLALGCENLTQDIFKGILGEYDEKRVKFLV